MFSTHFIKCDWFIFAVWKEPNLINFSSCRGQDFFHFIINSKVFVLARFCANRALPQSCSTTVFQITFKIKALRMITLKTANRYCYSFDCEGTAKGDSRFTKLDIIVVGIVACHSRKLRRLFEWNAKPLMAWPMLLLMFLTTVPCCLAAR